MTSAKPGSDRKAGRSNSRSSRRRAREFAVQGLYQWLVATTAVEAIEKHLADTPGFEKIDLEYFRTLLRGVITSQIALESALTPYLDRPIGELSPIERGILLLAGFELRQQLDVPYRVVINEAVELAKTFGGTEGHKYVNGVLDKLATVFRSVETGGR
ncbi:MAG: transcription antitermination factor NusB [Pseudomonadota bacterium]